MTHSIKYRFDLIFDKRLYRTTNKTTMKNLKLSLSVLFMLFLLSSCSKETESIEMPEMQPIIGEAKALLNGEPVVFLAYAMKNGENDLIRLELDMEDPSTAYDRNISISNIPLTIGRLDKLYNFTSPVMKSRSYCYYTAADGDAIYAFYDLVENLSETRFEIEDITEETNMIKGTFDITLAIEEGMQLNDKLLLEDTIRLTLGTFEAPLR